VENDHVWICGKFEIFLKNYIDNSLKHYFKKKKAVELVRNERMAQNG
jgi:hypothetical protein